MPKLKCQINVKTQMSNFKPFYLILSSRLYFLLFGFWISFVIWILLFDIFKFMLQIIIAYNGFGEKIIDFYRLIARITKYQNGVMGWF